MSLTELERAVCEAVAAGRDELVELASVLVAFDTTAREVGDPPREEAALQEHLAARLRAAGADIDLFEPDAGELAGAPLVPEGLDFAGRPQLIATLRGAGGGQSLLFNGHIDVVSGEPKAEWTTDPFTPEIRDGKLFGRGACDMKGGVAAMTFAAEAIARAGVTLAGDLIVATNTDEESSGAGGAALVQRGLSHLGGLSGLGVRRHPRPGPSRPRRGAPSRLAPRRCGQRHREGGRRPGRDRLAARAVGRRRPLSPPGALGAVAAAHRGERRRVAGHLPLVV
jgi:hypothetical protein